MLAFTPGSTEVCKGFQQRLSEASVSSSADSGSLIRQLGRKMKLT